MYTKKSVQKWSSDILMDILLEYSVYSTFPINSDISGVLKSHSKTTFHSVTAFLILPVHIELVCDYGIPDYGAGYTVGYTEFYTAHPRF